MTQPNDTAGVGERVASLMATSDAATIAALYPQDQLHEQIMIATALNRPAWLEECGRLSINEFFLEEHREIWASIERHMALGKPISAEVIASDLRDNEAVQEAGGLAYLVDLGGAVPFRPYAAQAAAAKLRSLHVQRQALWIATAYANDVLDCPADEAPETTVGRALEAFAQLQASMPSEERESLDDQLDAILQRAEDAKRTPVRKVLSGLHDMDESIGGYRAGELHIIAGRPGMGKTIVGANIAVNAAMAGHGVIYFSMEMAGDQIGGRVLCDLVHRGGHELWTRSLRQGDIPKSLMQPLIKARDELRDMPLHIDDRRGITLAQIGATCRRMAREFEKQGRALDIIVIDYMTLIQPADRYRGNKVAEVTELSRGLKILAGEMGIPVIALCQLNRQTESRQNADNRPRLSDLRESGSIEQDADSVTLLYREEYYVQQKKPAVATGPEAAAWQAQYMDAKDRLELIVAKNREGETGTIAATVIARCSAVRDA